MDWIDTWHCNSCGATNSESRDVCHKCGFRRKRFLKPLMVPWILAAFVFGSFVIVKLYVEKSDHVEKDDPSAQGL